MKKDPLFFPHEQTVPAGLATAVCHIEPLHPRHVHLDYAALMESKAMLRLWSGSPWPQDDFSLDDNLADLTMHWREHEARVAFTYTILNPAQDRCLGCVYLRPLAEVQTVQPVGDSETAVRFWITHPLNHPPLDATILSTLVDWLHHDWPWRRVLFHTPSANLAQLALFARCGLHNAFTAHLPDRGGDHQFWA
jgi:hypothetical protein